MTKKLSVEDTERLMANLKVKNAQAHQKRLARIDKAERQALAEGKEPFDVDAIDRLRRVYRNKDGSYNQPEVAWLREDYFCRFPDALTIVEYVAARRERDAWSGEH